MLNNTRRSFLKTSLTVGAAGLIPASEVLAKKSEGSDFTYEVVRSEEEWRSMFDDELYKILREGDTEWPKSSKWWNDYRDGQFSCTACGLHNYDSVWRVSIDKGWVFFSQSRPDSMLMGIDGEPPSVMADDKTTATIEVHCRRCGSHMGHVLKVEGQVVHCINGKALDFDPA